MKLLWNLLTPMMRSLVILGLAALLVLCVAGGAWMGMFYQRLQDAVTISALRYQVSETSKTLYAQRELATFYYQSNQAIQLDLNNLQTEKQANEKRYQDSLLVIHHMLPDDAERKIAAYYTARK